MSDLTVHCIDELQSVHSSTRDGKREEVLHSRSRDLGLSSTQARHFPSLGLPSPAMQNFTGVLCTPRRFMKGPYGIPRKSIQNIGFIRTPPSKEFCDLKKKLKTPWK